MNKEKLSKLQTSYMGKIIEYYEEIDSTNTRAKEWAKEGAQAGSMVLAEMQNSGKGRLGRLWVSPSGVGIWMSIILRPDVMPVNVPQVTLVAGLSMCKAIRQVTGLEAQIKWPNDIVVASKKVCGILTEMSATMEKVNYVVVGVGVNVNTTEFDESIPYASSLAREGQKQYEREEIIKAFAEIFEEDCKLFEEDKSLKNILKEYKDYCITLNKEVRISNNQVDYIAYVEDISEDGSLIIKKQDGTYEKVFAGEVSVRGLYGYV